MELQYEQALEQYGLSVSELSEDAKIGIEQINSVIKGINMLQKSGKQVSDKTFNKLKAMDKWVYYEILDQVQGTDENEEEIPYEDQEVIEDAEEEAYEEEEEENEQEESDDEEEEDEEEYEDDEDEDEEELPQEPIKNNDGFQVDKELQATFESGKTTIKLNELKSLSPTAYKIIFDSYDDSGDNGIITTNFTLIETGEEEFTLTKN